MANRSSLELMLEKIQQLEDQPKDIPPALPARPVSRARGGRPLRLNFHRQNFENENGVFRCEIKGTTKEELVRTMDNCEGIDVIQKWYRGLKVRRSYEELRTGVLALQSFIRGENARRNYEYTRRKMLEAVVVIQKHARKYFNHKRGIGGYRNQWHCNETEHEPKAKTNEDSLLNVPYDVVVDLWRRVLVTEARAREKKEESEGLRIKIWEIGEKWKQHEERMATMEKAWQHQLMHIQKCLAAAKSHEASPGFIRFEKYIHPWQSCRENAVRNHGATNGALINGAIPDLHLPINGLGDHEHNEDSDAVEVSLKQGSDRLHPQEELCKLKHRFKAWKREYRDKLREVQWTLKKLGDSQAPKIHKHWWGRLS